MPDITYDVGRVSFVMKGAWNLATSYEKLDVVSYGGSLYIAKQDVPGGTAITNTTYWQLAAEKGDKGDTGDIDTVGGTLRQVLAVKAGINFTTTAYVDLSSATWSNYSTNLYSAPVVADAKSPASDWSAAAAISTKYAVTSRNGLTEGTLAIKQGSVLFYSVAVGSAANVPSVMQGVLLAYEKA